MSMALAGCNGHTYLEAGPTSLVEQHEKVDGGYLVPEAKAKYFVVSPDRMAKLVKAANEGD